MRHDRPINISTIKKALNTHICDIFVVDDVAIAAAISAAAASAASASAAGATAAAAGAGAGLLGAEAVGTGAAAAGGALTAEAGAAGATAAGTGAGLEAAGTTAAGTTGESLLGGAASQGATDATAGAVNAVNANQSLLGSNQAMLANAGGNTAADTAATGATQPSWYGTGELLQAPSDAPSMLQAPNAFNGATQSQLPTQVTTGQGISALADKAFANQPIDWFESAKNAYRIGNAANKLNTALSPQQQQQAKDNKVTMGGSNASSGGQSFSAQKGNDILSNMYPTAAVPGQIDPKKRAMLSALLQRGRMGLLGG